MALRITLTDGASPAGQIRDQIRVLIITNQLPAGESLPFVRRLAKDLKLAPGTVAKAHCCLEHDGLLQTRVGGGTRVHFAASMTIRAVIDRPDALAQSGIGASVGVDDAIRILRVVWPRLDAGSTKDSGGSA